MGIITEHNNNVVIVYHGYDLIIQRNELRGMITINIFLFACHERGLSPILFLLIKFIF